MDFFVKIFSRDITGFMHKTLNSLMVYIVSTIYKFLMNSSYSVSTFVLFKNTFDFF